MTVAFTVWDSTTIIVYHQIILNDGITEVTAEMHPGDSYYGVTFDQFRKNGSGLREIPAADM